MKILRILLVLAVISTTSAALHAWYAKGHRMANALALRSLPKEMPEFFRDGLELMNNVVADPDTFTRPVAPPQLHNVEALNHYFDIEPLAGEKLPLTRYEFLELCYRKKLQPSKVGLLPYVVVEGTQRLSVVFAEYRRNPWDKNIQTKCLVYAALLAHYAQDLCQPLHTTVDYDGRARADGSSPHTDIHAKIDRLLGQLKTDTSRPSACVEGGTPSCVAGILPASLPFLAVSSSEQQQQQQDADKPLGPPGGMPATHEAKMAATHFSAATQPKSRDEVQAHRQAEAARARELLDTVLAEVHRSHDLVDKVYAMEKDLPANWKDPLSPKVEAFARERLDRAAQFTASLFLTAWRDSRFIEFPQRNRDGE